MSADAALPVIHGPRPGDPVAVESILRALPTWFGIEQSILDYAAAAPTLATWTVAIGAETVGFLCARCHFAHAAEIHVMAVQAAHHRQGLGSLLLAAAQDELRAGGVGVLQVKTLSPQVEHEPYARTRAFYEAHGFVALEDFTELWDAANPCRLYVKTLA